VTLREGEEIIREGAPLEALYLLLGGEVVVTTTAAGEEPVRFRGGEAGGGAVPHFGQEALVELQESGISRYTATVASGEARCLTLAGAAFRADRVGLATCSAFSSRASGDSAGQGSSRRSSFKSTSSWSEAAATSLDLGDLRHVRYLGRGQFGAVDLYEHPRSGRPYAVKTLQKATVAERAKTKAHVRNEKYILEMTDSPLVVKLYRTCQSPDEIYFIMEPCLGGELRQAYRDGQLRGSEAHARYYTASVACALEHLHARFVVYRDLKTENLLLDRQGRLKLTDMGLAKFVIGKTYTTCGTFPYLAPEVLRRRGYTLAVDWWQLGVLLWELLLGKTPFVAQSYGETAFNLFDTPVLRDLQLPDYKWPALPEAAREVLRALLDYDPSRRLPLRPRQGGGRGLRGLAWFRGLDWEALEEGGLPPPYEPPDREPRQPSMRRPPKVKYVDDGTAWDSIF